MLAPRFGKDTRRSYALSPPSEAPDSVPFTLLVVFENLPSLVALIRCGPLSLFIAVTFRRKGVSL